MAGVQRESPIPEIHHYLRQLVNDLAIDSTYTLIAAGYIMVYGIIDMINFTHGEMYMIGLYITFITITLLAMMGLDSVPLIMLAAFIASIIITSASGYSIERVAYHPLHGGDRLTLLIPVIGMSIPLQSAMMLSQDSKEKAVPTLLSDNFVFGESSINGMVISYIQILIFIITFLVMFGLTLFISHSRLGRACRAYAEDLKMVSLLDINSNDIAVLTFVIGTALTAVATVLLGMQHGAINPGIGFLVGIRAFTAAVLGGTGSIPGTMFGGPLLGVAEAFGADMFGDQYKDVVAFDLLTLTLLFRPIGALDHPRVEKA